MTCVEGGIEAQTKQVMENMKAILENAGCDFSNGECSDKYGTIFCFEIISRAILTQLLKIFKINLTRDDFRWSLILTTSLNQI